MLKRTKIFLLLLVLHCPPSLLIPLAQQDDVSASNSNSLSVNKIEQIIPKNSIATEVIQQIDVKDNENGIKSNINHVVINEESNEKIQSDIIGNIQNVNNETQNGTHNLVPSNIVLIGNASFGTNTAGLTNPLNNSSSLLSNSSILKAENIELPELQNRNILNNTSSNNATVHILNNGSTSIEHSILNNLASRETNKSIFNNKLTSNLKGSTVGTGDYILETVNEENVLHEDMEAEIAWRSDIPIKRRRSKGATKPKLNSQNASLVNNDINGSLLNNSNLLKLNNSLLVDILNTDQEKSVFMIVNSGNIDGLTVNSPTFGGNTQTNLNHNNIKNLNSNNSKLFNDIVNSTINNVFSKILHKNCTNVNSKHIFLLLNSGQISNIHINSPVLDNNDKNIILKDRSRRHLNDSNTNNTRVKSANLKPSNDTSSPTDIKFRTDELLRIVSSNSQNNTDNVTVINTNAPKSPEVNTTENEEISSAEARKIYKASQNEPVKTEEHNLILNLSPESSPISIDLNQIPLNNLLGGALSFMKRLKRNTYIDSDMTNPVRTICKTIINKHIDKNHAVKSCTKSKLCEDDKILKLTPTRKSMDDNFPKELKTYDFVELVCPLSVIVKLYTHQILDKLNKNDTDIVINKILSSFVKGHENAINLASKELSNLPIPIKLRLQLIHGKTNEFMEQLSNKVDATLCA